MIYCNNDYQPNAPMKILKTTKGLKKISISITKKHECGVNKIIEPS